MYAIRLHHYFNIVRVLLSVAGYMYACCALLLCAPSHARSLPYMHACTHAHARRMHMHAHPSQPIFMFEEYIYMHVYYHMYIYMCIRLSIDLSVHKLEYFQLAGICARREMGKCPSLKWWVKK